MHTPQGAYPLELGWVLWFCFGASTRATSNQEGTLKFKNGDVAVSGKACAISCHNCHNCAHCSQTTREAMPFFESNAVATHVAYHFGSTAAPGASVFRRRRAAAAIGCRAARRRKHVCDGATRSWRSRQLNRVTRMLLYLFQRFLQQGVPLVVVPRSVQHTVPSYGSHPKPTRCISFNAC